MIFTNYIRFCPLIWFTLIFGSYAYDLSERLEPKGALKVRLDHDLAITWPNRLKKKGKQIRRTFLWSTHLKFMNPVSEINDGQLWQMADDAYKEMQAEQKLYGVNSKKDTPKAISILAFGNEIIISSTIKGMKPFAYEYKKSAVSATLQKCQSDWAEAGGSADQRHKNQGGCSEVMSAQLYYSIYSKDDNPLSGRNARICAVVAVGDSPAERENPCGTDRTDIWGCNKFVAEEGLDDIDKTIDAESYDLSTLAGGIDTIDQIQICEASESESESGKQDSKS